MARYIFSHNIPYNISVEILVKSSRNVQCPGQTVALSLKVEPQAQTVSNNSSLGFEGGIESLQGLRRVW